MRPLPLNPHRMASWAYAIATALRGALREGSHRTGVPVILLAGGALVLSWHVFRRTLRLVVQMLLVTVLLFVATHLGWVSW